MKDTKWLNSMFLTAQIEENDFLAAGQIALISMKNILFNFKLIIEKEKLIFSFAYDSSGIEFLKRIFSIEEITGLLDKFLDEKFGFLIKEKHVEPISETTVEGPQLKVNLQIFYSQPNDRKEKEN